MRFLRQALAGLFLVALTAGLMAWAGYMVFSAVQERAAQEPRVPQSRERVFAVNVVQAQPGTVTPVLTAFGEVQSRRTLELRAAAGGTLVELAPAFQDGGRVAAGDVLARIDPADAQAALDRARSDLADAEAEARDARRALDLARDELASAEEQAAIRIRAFERQQNLKTRGVGTDAAVETAEIAASSAKAAVLSRRQALAQAEARVDQAGTGLQRARIALSEAERHLEDTRIIAGFDGTLTDVTAVEGGLVSAGEQLGRLVDPGRLEVALRLSTAAYGRLLDDAGRLREAPATVALDVYGVDMTSPAVLARDSAAVGEGLSGRLVFARVIEPRGLKPGDFVTVTIEEPPLEDAIRLPATALGPDGSVLVTGAGNRLETVQTELLRRQGDDVLVRAAALAGRLVVAERSPLLGAGIKVRPLGEAAAGAAPEEDEMVTLTEDRRAKLIEIVEANKRLPSEAKARILTRLQQDRVPAQMVARIETPAGG